MKVNSGSMGFDPHHRSTVPGRSIAEDPDAAAAFQDALRKAGEKAEKTAEDGDKPGQKPFFPAP